MDKLYEIMMGREMGVSPSLPGPTGLPSPVPNQKQSPPPEAKRYATGLKMQHAYANGWQPNPILLQVLEGNK